MIDIYPVERDRIKFLLNRDGVDATAAFCKQTFKIYRRALRTPYGKAFRRTLIQSCLDFRRFLRNLESMKRN
jgi:hypothetical protein